MGCYDNILIDKKDGQVKIWNSIMKTYQIEDKVPAHGAYKTYSIAMREGGYVNISDCVLQSWTDEPKHKPVFDKWGAPYNKKFRGTFGEKYTF